MNDSTKDQSAESPANPKPYRTPAEVAENEPAPLKNVMLWVGAAVLAAIILMISLSWLMVRSTNEVNSVNLPTEEISAAEIAEYEQLMEYEAQLSYEPLPDQAP